MEMGSILKYGALLLVGVLLVRWGLRAFAGSDAYSPGWIPQARPNGPRGGSLSGQTPHTGPRYPNHGTGRGGRGRRGDNGR